MSGKPKWRKPDDAYWYVYAYVMARSTANAGWTRAQLATWNVTWPPPQGWKDQLIKDVLACVPDRRRWTDEQIAAVIGHSPAEQRLPEV